MQPSTFSSYDVQQATCAALHLCANPITSPDLPNVLPPMACAVDKLIHRPSSILRNGFGKFNSEKSLLQASTLISELRKQSPSASFNLDQMIASLANASVCCKTKPAAPTGPSYSHGLTENDISWLLAKARQVLLTQDSLLELRAPLTIVGDVRGQLQDVTRIFDTVGHPARNTNYLFLGNYTNSNEALGIETLCLLLALKVKFPENVFLLRGKRECVFAAGYSGFPDQLRKRKWSGLWKQFCETFDCLPFAATVGDKIFCVHGGLSPELTSLDQIRSVSRPLRIGQGLLTDLLYCEPDSSQGEDWHPIPRGEGYTFGTTPVINFLDKFYFDLVVAAGLRDDGFEFFPSREDPMLVAIFSVPRCGGEFDNKGAVMVVDQDLKCNFKIFKR